MKARKKVGLQSMVFSRPVAILSSAACVGPLEGAGPLQGSFDVVYPDLLIGAKSWEAAETTMIKEAVEIALGKGSLSTQSVDYLLAGDLLNQCIAANFAARDLGIPMLGLYGACSTMAESAGLGAVLIDGGFAQYTVAAASSHNATSERQYRYPTEYGGQRPPYSQHTVTAAGALLLSNGLHCQSPMPRITHFTVGKVCDLGIKDPFDMGSAMAPAAADTLLRHFADLALAADHYDLVVTGDLAYVGHAILKELLHQSNLDLGSRLNDCGLMIYDRHEQPVFAGGSGCGSSAAVLCGYLLDMLSSYTIKRLLLVGTGALLSPVTYQQGETIPCVAHAVAIEMCHDHLADEELR
ncbi:MAG: stage V sporulation protein AD [Firmicutes bacterium]|nr:stage V sporulation protein AD [Dethiobacter sp.]MBS3889340.1 stage V sporulation protein AD [Bacillota bacterium]MBS4055023.1 stage V sporulation protein AD [Thermaerobacter sp.]